MQKILFIAGISILFGMFLLVPGLTVASGSETTGAILDVLHSRGDITDAQYEELKGKAEKEDRGFITCFDKRLHIDSADGRFKMEIGGRIMMDAGCITADRGLKASADASGNPFEGLGGTPAATG